MKEAITILCLFWCGTAAAQSPGFLGKKISVYGGVCLQPPILKVESYDLKYTADPSILPPKINLGIEKAIKKKTNFTVFGSYYAMDNTSFYFENSGMYSSNYEVIADTFTNRTNMFSLNAALKFYQTFNHYGNYVALGVSSNQFQTRVFRTTSTSLFEVNRLIYNTVEKLEPTTVWTHKLGLTVAGGRQVVLENNCTVDYGARMSIFLRRNIYPEGTNYNENVDKIVNHVVSNLAWNSQFFEIYLNIGLLMK